MKVYITKYALTHGIMEEEAEEVSQKMIRVRSRNYDSFFHGNEWHTSKKQAIAQAEKMRTKRIISLEKSIEKLKK